MDGSGSSAPITQSPSSLLASFPSPGPHDPSMNESMPQFDLDNFDLDFLNQEPEMTLVNVEDLFSVPDGSGDNTTTQN
jgi:hypothetical protein